MDFGTLLHVAKQNNASGKNSEGKYYKTKFSAPKKESKEKKLSDNIKKFLAKQEQEEREKAREEKKRRDELLAMRDEKAKNKIKKMLKVIKSANKSVLEDAVDTQNTAVTLHGPEQPDEDDYGYVSQEAAAFYQKYMDKVKSLPDDNKFAPSRPHSRTDLSGTKDRVRAAIMKEQDDINFPQHIKSAKPSVPSSSTINGVSYRKKDLYDSQAEKDMEEKKRREEEQKKSKSKKPARPALDFQQLLKLAEKKQHEPVEIVVETKKEPERLLTKREKKEMEDLKEREKRKKEQQTSGNKMQPNGRIPKLNGNSTPNGVSSKVSPQNTDKNSKLNGSQKPAQSNKDVFKKPDLPTNLKNGNNEIKSRHTSNDLKPSSSSNSNSSKPKPVASNQNLTKSANGSSISTSKSTLPSKNAVRSSLSTTSKPSGALQSSQKLSQSKPSYNGQTREFPPKDNNIRKPVPHQQNSKTKQLPSSDVQKTRQFPPPDVQRTRQFPPADIRNSRTLKKPMANKRRIVDDDDSEYDSELDDFIDDGPEEGQNYSSYIKEIFGYDKSRYRDLDEDDAGMESTFSQQMKEEFISKKIGLMEDLEDMRLEAEEKKKKSMKKRKLK